MSTGRALPLDEAALSHGGRDDLETRPPPQSSCSRLGPAPNTPRMELPQLGLSQIEAQRSSRTGEAPTDGARRFPSRQDGGARCRSAASAERRRLAERRLTRRMQPTGRSARAPSGRRLPCLVDRSCGRGRDRPRLMRKSLGGWRPTSGWKVLLHLRTRQHGGH